MKIRITQDIAKVYIALIGIVVLLSGCATVHDMGVNKSTEKINLNGIPLKVLTI